MTDLTKLKLKKDVIVIVQFVSSWTATNQETMAFSMCYMQNSPVLLASDAWYHVSCDQVLKDLNVV